MPKWLKAVVGVVLLPFCWGAARALSRVVAASSGADTFWVAFGAGLGIWLTFFFLLPKPRRAYIFGHELTHALWTWAMGGRVKSFKVGRRGGQVVVDRHNFLVVLAPYFCPIYALIVVGVFLIGDSAWGWRSSESVFHLLLGLAYGFHVTFTLDVLRTRQSDIASQGWLFASTVIWLGNVLLLTLGVALLTRSMGLLAALGAWLVETGRIYTWLSQRL